MHACIWRRLISVITSCKRLCILFPFIRTSICLAPCDTPQARYDSTALGQPTHNMVVTRFLSRFLRAVDDELDHLSTILPLAEQEAALSEQRTAKTVEGCMISCVASCIVACLTPTDSDRLRKEVRSAREHLRRGVRNSAKLALLDHIMILLIQAQEESDYVMDCRRTKALVGSLVLSSSVV